MPDSTTNYFGQWRTYSEYNYLRPGPISWIKRGHFRKALRLTTDHPENCSVIDFGCGDGFFIPTLAKRFRKVVGIDKSRKMVELCSFLIKEMDIENAELICSENMTVREVKSKLGMKSDIVFLLETLEHIGEPGRLYESQLDFLRELAELSDTIVFSIPKMVGFPLILQRVGLWAFRMNREPISLRTLLRAGFLRDNSELEKSWHGGHLGFDYRELEKCISDEFRIAKKASGFFQNVYVLEKIKEV